MAIGNIISDIKGAFESVLNIFGLGDNSLNYPNAPVDPKTVTNIPKYNDKSWQSSKGYAFEVRLTDQNGATKPAPGWKEFRLQINPQELTQDEIFAIEVTPTFRGVMVEHHGTIMKDITIAGTTGISPMRRDGGASFKSGDPILQSGHSGFKEFHEFRTYIRMYVENKRKESAVDKRKQGELRLVFKNFKDSEYLFVEPIKFTMKRSASRPFLYDYNIQLKAIGVASDITPKQPTFFESLDNVLEDIQGYFELGSKVINGGIGIIRRTERDITNTILNPIRAISLALIAIRGGQLVNLGLAGITRRFIDSLNREIQRVENNFNDVIGRDMNAYNGAAGRTSTLVGTPRQSSYQELQILNGLNALKKGLVLLASQQDTLFDKDVFQTNADVANQFSNAFTLDTPNSVSDTTILDDDNLQSIAGRELGDPDKYRDIVILNNLKPPYIDSAGGVGVLKPGQKILLPKGGANFGATLPKNKEWNITRQLQEQEKHLGIDIRIDDNGDMAISNIKDLDLIGGMENMVQVVGLKLLLERGSLKRHPEIGTGLQIGRKTRSSELDELRQEITSSYGQDPRVESIPFIELTQESGTLQINTVLKVRNVDRPIPIPLTLNNG